MGGLNNETSSSGSSVPQGAGGRGNIFGFGGSSFASPSGIGLRTAGRNLGISIKECPNQRGVVLESCGFLV